MVPMRLPAATLFSLLLIQDKTRKQPPLSYSSTALHRSLFLTLLPGMSKVS